MLEIVPLSFKQAQQIIDLHHRHHKAPQGCKFCIGATYNGQLVGAAIVGRPVSRHKDDGFTLEVTRCCAIYDIKNVCSFLYGACCRVAKAMGYLRMITYNLEDEGGASLRGAGWEWVTKSRGGSWNSPKRPRQDKHPTGPKNLYIKDLYKTRPDLC